MTLTIQPLQIPITVGEDGIARLADTRVRLETVVEAYLEGLTAEEISCRYTTLQLHDIYFAIGYYLKNRYEVEKYLRMRRDQGKAVRERLLAGYDLTGPRRRAPQADRFDRITLDPQPAPCGPRIRDLDLPAAAILGCLGSGMTVEDLLLEWPGLEPEDISQALAYAALAIERAGVSSSGDRPA